MKPYSQGVAAGIAGTVIVLMVGAAVAYHYRLEIVMHILEGERRALISDPLGRIVALLKSMTAEPK